MDQDRKKDWRELCKAAANELDPAKLMDIIAELTRALDQHEKRPVTVREDTDRKDTGATAFQKSESVA
jgi:hypothetical protein